MSLTPREVVLAGQSRVGGKEVRIHHPRWNYRIRAVSAAGGANLYMDMLLKQNEYNFEQSECPVSLKA